MKKTILKFGLISGGIMSLLMSATVPFAHKIGNDKALFIGYTTMVLSFLLVYFGIRSYREDHGGQITFWRGFGIGICIMLITCVCYVITWEIIYFNFMHDFMDQYGAHQIERARAAGASAAAIQAQIEQARKFKQMYENPLINSAMTFIEPFPVGFVIALLSAVILRKKTPSQVPASA
jgi:Protein of unknown function (DUF4199)